MKLLYLAQRVPFPPDRGDKIITYHEVRHLARHHEVVVACLAQDPAEFENARQLRGIAAEVHAIPLSPMHARARALASLVRGRPFTLGYFDEPELRRVVGDLLATGSVDAAFAFCSGVAQFVDAAEGLPRLLHLVDMDSQKWRQYAQTSAAPMRWVYALEAQRLLAYERRLAGLMDHSFVCTDNELADFRRLAGEARITSLANGVDTDYYRPDPAGVAKADEIVFTGVMNYAPNVDCVVWFCQKILPEVRRRIPSATFTICGAHPSQAVLDLARIEGVVVTGRVPDVRPYLAQAALAVAPLRIARGVQNKVLEAMAMGLPVVATPAAHAGIDAAPGRELLIAAEAQAFADQVCMLLADEGQRRRIGAAARLRIEQRYSWDAHMAEIDARLDEAVRRARAA